MPEHKVEADKKHGDKLESLVDRIASGGPRERRGDAGGRSDPAELQDDDEDVQNDDVEIRRDIGEPD
jgi:hypothetical protein